MFSAADKETRHYFEIGKGITKRRCEGITTGLKLDRTDPHNTIGIDFPAYALGTPYIHGSRYLATYGLKFCVAIIIHDQDKHIGFMTHVNSPKTAIDALRKSESILRNKRMTIYGGGNSRFDTVATIEGYLKENSGIEIIGIKTTWDTSENSYYYGYRSVATDTLDGRIFIPTNEVNVFHKRTLPSFFRSDQTLQYDGLDVAPLESFIRIAKS